MTDATLDPGPDLSLRGTSARRRNESVIRTILVAAAVLSILISAGIVLTLIFEAISFVGQIKPEQLFAQGWFPRRGMFSLPTVLAGTLIITGVAMVIAAPIGLASAIYLSEYASHRVRGIIKPILEILAGIPSVVLGFFALTWISPTVVQSIFTDAKGFNLLAAGIGVGILTIPLVASISEDAMRAVPVALREASYGLGARRLSTCMRVVVPAAISGIVAAMILAVSRAIGETMVVAVAAGASGGSLFTLDPTGPGQTLTGAMAA
jgi:phosphate transport system permease protein